MFYAMPFFAQGSRFRLSSSWLSWPCIRNGHGNRKFLRHSIHSCSFLLFQTLHSHNIMIIIERNSRSVLYSEGCWCPFLMLTALGMLFERLIQNLIHVYLHNKNEWFHHLLQSNSSQSRLIFLVEILSCESKINSLAKNILSFLIIVSVYDCFIIDVTRFDVWAITQCGMAIISCLGCFALFNQLTFSVGTGIT